MTISCFRSLVNPTSAIFAFILNAYFFTLFVSCLFVGVIAIVIVIVVILLPT